MKKVLKFIIKMLITAGIIVGVVFLVSYFVTPKTNAAKITKTESDYNLVSKIQKSFDGFKREDNSTVKDIVTIMPETPSQYPSFTKSDNLPASKKVSDIFVVYYQYYVSTSAYIKKDNNGLQSNIIGQMQKLSSQVDKTIEYLDFVDKYVKTKNYSTSNYSNDNVFFARFDKWVESYQKQTFMLMNLVDDLRQYVCDTHYQSSVNDYAYTGEVKLEVVKDYAKAVFVDALNEKIKDGTAVNPILKDGSNASFLSVYSKFVSTIESIESPDFAKLFVDSNKGYELRMFQSYGEIEKTNLFNSKFDIASSDEQNLVAGFYQLSSDYSNQEYQKTHYFYNETESLTDNQKNACLRNFVDIYYGEDVVAGTSKYYIAQHQHIALNALYNYLLGASLWGVIWKSLIM